MIDRLLSNGFLLLLPDNDIMIGSLITIIVSVYSILTPYALIIS